ncbi:MAG: NADH-quinone oxidoreductase subunit NuoE [Gammaproteobacteria bacterium]|jgi:NADH-quinone oxidoreductase subunit E
MLSQTSLEEIELECAKYPAERRQSAILAALRIAQDELGWLSNETIEYIAKVIGVPAVRAYEVATFYSMYHLEPVGKNVIYLCTNISCMLRGCDQIQSHIENKLNIKLGETTEDGRFTLQEVECLCACAGAPMMQINKDYHENLTPERVDEILERY